MTEDNLKTKSEAATGREASAVERIVMCGCKGSPCTGVACNYVTVGGKFCKAPEKHKCEFKEND